MRWSYDHLISKSNFVKNDFHGGAMLFIARVADGAVEETNSAHSNSKFTKLHSDACILAEVCMGGQSRNYKILEFDG